MGTMFFKVPFWRKNSPNYSGGPQKNWPLLPFLLISPKMIHQTGPVSFILYLVNQNTSYNPSNMFKNMNSIDKNREKLQIGQFFDLFWQSSFFLPTKAHQSEFFFHIVNSGSRGFIKGIKKHYPKIYFFLIFDPVHCTVGHYLTSWAGIMVNGVPREVPMPRDLPRESSHHDSPKAFPYDVILWSYRTSKEVFPSADGHPREYHG